MRGDFGYKDYITSDPVGQRVAQIVIDHADEIRILAKHGVPPVKAVDKPIYDLQAAIGRALSNSEKQFVGKAIYHEVLGTDRWEVEKRNDIPGLLVFSAGSTFVERKAKPVTIRRKDPRPGGDEYPIKSAGGYQLVRPGLVEGRTRAENAVYVRKLEEALPLLDAGYHIRMGRKGVRPSLISKGALIIEGGE